MPTGFDPELGDLLSDCEQEVYELRNEVHKLTQTIRNIVSAHRQGQQDVLEALILLCEDV